MQIVKEIEKRAIWKKKKTQIINTHRTVEYFSYKKEDAFPKVNLGRTGEKNFKKYRIL